MGKGQPQLEGNGHVADIRLPGFTRPLAPLVNLVARLNTSVHMKLLAGFLFGALLLLGMGILSLVVMPIILGPIAWVMANNDLKEMRAGRMDPEGESNTNAGRICGIIGIIMGSLGLICCFGYVFIVMIVGASGAFGRR